MRKYWASVWLVVACVGLAYGCGDDDDEKGVGLAGGGGRSGTAGGPGKAGHGGLNGGTSGRTSTTGGSSGIGDGGAAGHAGAGAPSVTGGGAGGEAGSCNFDVTPHKLGTACESVAIAEGDFEDTLTSNCSFEEACAAVKCGTLWSPYDESLCRRPLCHSSAECESGQRCVAPPLLGDFNCYFDYFSDGANGLQSDCSCAFEESECAPRAYCLPATEYPPEDDCPVASMSCDELAYGLVEPFDWLGPVTRAAGSTSDLVIALDDCSKKIRAAYAACQGIGGQGGASSP